MTGKVCSRCRQRKPYTAFNHEKKMKDGYASCCRECFNKGQRTPKLTKGERVFNGNMTKDIYEEPVLVDIVKTLYEGGPMRQCDIEHKLGRRTGSLYSQLVTLTLLEDYIKYLGKRFVLAEDDKCVLCLIECGV